MSGPDLNFDIPDVKCVKWHGDDEELKKRSLRVAIRELKKVLHTKEDIRTRIHITLKQQALEKYKNLKKCGKPKRGLCSVYDSKRDSTYELFRTYYKLVESVLEIEKRQNVQSRKRQKISIEEEKRDCCRLVQYAYWRWVDIGTPSISGYNRYREVIKYGTLFLTLIANGFKLALARMGGRASFVGTALQGLAHLSFALYFLLLTQDDKALALPKIVGLIISIVSCVWIADAGNGYL